MIKSTFTPAELICNELTSTIYELLNSINAAQLAIIDDRSVSSDVRLALIQEYDKLHMALNRKANEVIKRTA